MSVKSIEDVNVAIIFNVTSEPIKKVHIAYNVVEEDAFY